MELLELQARLAGAEIRDHSRMARKGEDPYGEMLKWREMMRQMDEALSRHPEKFFNRPL